MQDVKKLAGISLGINTWKTTLLKKSEPPHALYEACVMGNHPRTHSRVINRIDLYRRATKKRGLSDGNLAGVGKITCTLEGSRIVFGLTDDLTDLTEIHLLRKKSEAFYNSKNTPPNGKLKATLFRGLRVTMVVNLTRQPAKNGWR